MIQLQKTHTPVRDSWIICQKPNPRARLRLFCFPFAGSGATAFRDWSDYLSPEIEVCAIQLPGRESRLKEPPFTQMEALMNALVPNLLTELDCPFIFFGHSMGALVAFELAQTLRTQHGLVPAKLLFSGRKPPQLPYTPTPIDDLPTSAFITYLRDLDGIPPEVLDHPEFLHLMLPTIRADFMVCDTYSYVPVEPFDCPIAAFGGKDDPIVSRDELSKWREHTTRDFKLYIFPGKHFFVRNSSALLLQIIAQEINRVLQ